MPGELNLRSQKYGASNLPLCYPECHLAPADSLVYAIKVSYLSFFRVAYLTCRPDSIKKLSCLSSTMARDMNKKPTPTVKPYSLYFSAHCFINTLIRKYALLQPQKSLLN